VQNFIKLSAAVSTVHYISDNCNLFFVLSPSRDFRERRKLTQHVKTEAVHFGLRMAFLAMANIFQFSEKRVADL